MIRYKIKHMNNNRTVQNNEKKGNLEIDRNEKINYSEDKLNQSSYNTSMSPRIKIMTEFKKNTEIGCSHLRLINQKTNAKS